MVEPGRRRVLAAGAAAALAGVAGCGTIGAGGGGGDPDPEDRGPISVDELAFAAEAPEAYREYTPAADTTYAPQETIWLYTELSSLAGDPVESVEVEEPEDRRVDIDLTQELTVLERAGPSILDRTYEVDERLHPSQLDGYFLGNVVVLSASVTPGDYEVHVQVTDHVSDSTDTASREFEVVQS